MRRLLPPVTVVAVAVMSVAHPVVAQLPAVLTTQEALPPKVAGIARTREPVTVGTPLADAQGISDVSQLGLSGASAGQFRCLARWPSGHCKWVEVDYQLPSLSAGGQSNAVALTTGTGNFGGSDLATDSNPANPNSGTITVNTGSGGCSFIIRKANFDLLYQAICNGKNIVNGGSTGLALMGPAYNAGSPPTTTCTFNSTCTTLYASSNDPDSACGIEENGPVRAAIKCYGGLKDVGGNKHMGFLVRLHFYAGKQRVKLVTTLKNADDGPAGSFPISYKGYQSFELRLATQLTGINTWTIGNDGTRGSHCSGRGYCEGKLLVGQNAYIYHGYSTQNLDPGYNSALQFRTLVQANGALDITRSNRERVFAYAQDGYIVVGPAATILMSSTSSSVPRKPLGWADVKDSTGGQGITFGTDYMQGNFPRSLEIRNGGREIRVGISPDQALWTGDCGSLEPCQKIYYQPWPEYKIANLDLIFHDSDTSPYSEHEATLARSRFLHMQYPLIARAPIAYYNAARVFVYPLVDPVQHDKYMDGIAARHGKRLSALTDAVPFVTRFYDWSAGSSTNQVEYRYSDLVHRWLERGFTGRYLNAIWFTRFQEQFAWERADGINCIVNGRRYEGWACHTPTTDLSVYNASPSKCTFKLANACSDNGGMLPNNCTIGPGCQGGYVDPVADENSAGRHYHWWSAIYDYYMTGDEDVDDMLKDGVVNEYTAIGSADNYTTVTGNGNIATTPQWNRSWQASGANNRLPNSGSFGGRLNSAAHFWRYLSDTGRTQDANFVDTLIHNLLTVMYQEPCASTGTGSGNQNWPSGCTPTYDGSSTGQQSRGFSAYRGLFVGAGEHNNVVRCIPAAGQNVSSNGFGTTPGPYVRCVEPFMQGYLIDAIQTTSQLEGSSWSDYQKLLDLGYGDAINSDANNYLINLADAPYPSSGQLVYTMAFDQPNSLIWQNPASGGDANGFGPPFEPIYSIWGQYTGDEVTWRSHWENTFINRASAATYTTNNMPEYGSQLTDEVVDLMLNPPSTHLVTVGICSGGLTCSYDSETGQWTLTWLPLSGVSKYYLKENDTKKIVDNIGWSNATNQPLDPNVANDYNWFALGNNVLTAPPLEASTFTATAPSTAHFMLKAAVPASTGLARRATGSGEAPSRARVSILAGPAGVGP